jgi:hypothetical protein
MQTPSRCPQCKKEHINRTRWYTGNARLAPFRCTPCNQIEANRILREQKLSAELEKQLTLKDQLADFESWVQGSEDDFEADGSLAEYV